MVIGYDNYSVHESGRSRTRRQLNEEQANVVRRIFELRADGEGLAAIAKRLNAEGWRGALRRHVPQARQMLRKLLVGKLVMKPVRVGRKGAFDFSGEASLGRLLSGLVGFPPMRPEWTHRRWRPHRDSCPKAEARSADGRVPEGRWRTPSTEQSEGDGVPTGRRGNVFRRRAAGWRDAGGVTCAAMIKDEKKRLLLKSDWEGAE